MILAKENRDVLLARTVLVLGVLTALATSAPEEHFLTDSDRKSLVDDDVLQVTARANRAAFDHGVEVSVHISLHLVDPPVDRTEIQVRVIPDDSRLAITNKPLTSAIFRGDSAYTTYYLSEICIEGEDCQAGFSFEITEGVGTVDIDVEAESSASDGGGFCSPQDGSFPPDAAIEVTFDEP